MELLLNINPLFVYIGLCILVWLLFSFVPILKIIRVLRTPTESIGALPTEGLIEVMGRAGGMGIKSPITQSDCVMWQVDVEERRRSSKGGTYWTTIQRKLSGDAFEVHDETGKVQVFPDTRSILVLHTDALETNTGNDFDQQTQSALENLGVKTTGFLGFSRTLRVSERYVSKGDQVFINGSINYDNGVKTITGKLGASLIISDQSEQEVLSTYYGQIGMVSFIVILIGVIGRKAGIDLVEQLLR